LVTTISTSSQQAIRNQPPIRIRSTADAMALQQDESGVMGVGNSLMPGGIRRSAGVVDFEQRQGYGFEFSKGKIP
jgi:hypothetical protein